MNRFTASAALVLSVLTASLFAQEASFVQPSEIPGKYVMSQQPMPALATVKAMSTPDRPVYGLYIWANEFRGLREEIRKVGWKQLRFAGPWEDKTMTMVVEDDIEVMMTLSGKSLKSYKSEDELVDDYVKRIDTFLTRYGPNGTFFKDNPNLPNRPIKLIEVWNEPNFNYMIPERQPVSEVNRQRRALYARLLPTAHKTIKAKWPDVRVVGFGAGGSSAADLGFIDGIYKLDPKIAESYDILSTHPYVDPCPPEADRAEPWGQYSVLKSLLSIRKIIKSESTPIWYTEVGWAVSHADGGFFPTREGAKMTSPLLQAAYVTRLYALAARAGIGRVHIMFATDTDTYNAGFFLRDNSPRPSAIAVQTMIKLMPCPTISEAINDGSEGWYAWTFNPDARQKTDSAKLVTMVHAVAGPKHVQIPWNAPSATMVNMLGATSEITATETGGGKWLLPVDIGPCPVYLIPSGK